MFASLDRWCDPSILGAAPASCGENINFTGFSGENPRQHQKPAKESFWM
jgi:hypothetical protein